MAKYPLFLTKTGLFIVPFIPLYVSRVLFFPYITGKAFIFRVIVEIVFAAWVFLAIFYKEYRPRKTALLWAIGLFILVVTLATIAGVNPYKSFWSNFERMEGLLTHIHLFAYFLVLGHVFRKKDWLIFFNLFVVAGLIENGYALIQKLGYMPSPQGGFRVDGTIGNPTYLAAYLIFILAFCILLWFQTKNKPAKFFYGFVGLWSLLTIYFTATRGAALALLIGALGFGILYLIFKQTDSSRVILYKRFTIALLALALLAPAALWLAKDTEFIRNNETLWRFASIFKELSGEDRGSQARFIIWNMSWQGFKERPILGWGPENYELVFSKYYQPELYSKEPWFDRSHNIILDWLINAGILGLLSYLAIFIAALYLLWKNYIKKYLSIEITILIAVLFLVYFLQNLFVFDQLATYIGFFAVLAFIHNTAVSESPSPKQKYLEDKFNKLTSAPIMAAPLLALLVLVIYFVNYKPLLANLNLLNALKIQSQDFQGAFENYKKALSYNTLGNSEIREWVVRYALTIGAIPQVDADFKDKILRRAIEEAQKSVQENPLNPRPYLFLGNIYSGVGLWDEAIKVFNKALELSPKKQQIYFELGDMYIEKADYTKAVQVLEQAFNLEPQYHDARMNLIIAYILNGQQEKADELLIGYWGTVHAPAQFLIAPYFKIKNYERLLRVWQALVKDEPENTEYRARLASAHLLLGQREEAIRVLEEAIRLDPAFKEEGELFIEQIRAGY